MEFINIKKDQRKLIDFLKWIETLNKKNDFHSAELFKNWILKNLNLQDPYGVFIVFENKILGTASIIPDEEDIGRKLNFDGIWIGGIIVDKDYRNKGIGKFIMSNLCKYLEKIDKKVYLMTNNPISLKLYEKFGFIEEQHITNEDNERLLIMVKDN